MARSIEQRRAPVKRQARARPPVRGPVEASWKPFFGSATGPGVKVAPRRRADFAVCCLRTATSAHGSWQAFNPTRGDRRPGDARGRRHINNITRDITDVLRIQQVS
jgi:hypothetical protein